MKRASTSGAPYINLSTDVTATTYTNTGLTNGTAYYYVVSAVNGSGTSGSSTQVGATSVSAAIGAYEGPALAFDAQTSTKWFTGDSASTGWLQYQFEAGLAKVVTGYVLTRPTTCQGATRATGNCSVPRTAPRGRPSMSRPGRPSPRVFSPKCTP